MTILLHILFKLFLAFAFCAEASETCPFCNPEVLAKQQVYETRLWRVLVDYKPVTKGHLLLIPKAHRLTRYDLTQQEANELYPLQNRFHLALQKRFNPSIENIQYEKNSPKLQSVHHFHIHLLPINPNSWLNNFSLAWRLFVYCPRLSHAALEQEQKAYLEAFHQD